MRNIAGKLLGIGGKIRRGIQEKLTSLSDEVHEIFTKIRLFTRGKGEKVIEKKKALSGQLQQTVAKMQRLVRGELAKMGDAAKARYEEKLDLYRKMLSQIRHWMRTGFHPNGKIISLWLQEARAITRNKAGKMTEFGRRWIITRLSKGYMIGKACCRLGSGSDSALMPEILEHFERMVGEKPKLAVYDRGGDGRKNHRTLKDNGITNAIFRKGKQSQPGLGRNTKLLARRERALSEASIATLKTSRYAFNRPRARSQEACILKGHFAIFGANLTHFARDWGWAAN
jgi:hypothetical protein